MLGNVISFVELGGIIVAWMIFWNYVIGAFTGLHADSPAAQGFNAIWQS